MFEDFLHDTCDIYHAINKGVSPGYGLPVSDNYEYPDKPDIVGQICHFGIKNGTTVVMQNEPTNDYEARIKLTLPSDTDIRVNDKVIDINTGYSYKVEIPRKIRNHHKIVYIRRDGIRRAL